MVRRLQSNDKNANGQIQWGFVIRSISRSTSGGAATRRLALLLYEVGCVA